MDKQVAYIQSIKNSYPDLDVRTTRLHTAEGQFNDILFINDDLIFRIPRYEESIDNFLQEIEILRKLYGCLSVQTPNPIYVSAMTKEVGKVFMGYQIIPGKPLFRQVLNEITGEAILEKLARQLADFLHQLHTLSPAAIGLNLQVHDQLSEVKQLFFDVQEHLFLFMRPTARNSVIRQFEDYIQNKSLHQYAPSIIHGDFGGSNILFEADHITGVIDFSSAGLGDPAIDLAAVSTLGNPFFRRISNYYSAGDLMLERIRFYRSTFALQEALHGFKNNDQAAFKSGMEQYI